MHRSSLLSSPNAGDDMSMGNSFRKRPAGGYDSRDSDRRDVPKEPGRVVFVSDMRCNTCELEVKRAFQPYGRIYVILMIPYKRQALIEFYNANDARELVDSAKRGCWVNVGDKNVLVDFSKHSQVDFATEPFHTREPSNIISMAIFNSRINFKCDAVLKICEPFGFIQQCVITREDNGITKAIVEFDKLEEAVLAKPHLNGADMFPNCNSIRIDYAKRNAFDFVTQKEHLIDEYRFDYDHRPPMTKRSRYNAPDLNGGASASMPPVMGGLSSYYDEGPRDFPDMPPPAYPSLAIAGGGGHGGHRQQHGRGFHANAAPGDMHNLPRQSIVIVKGLSDKMNCDRLFNIFCLFGNVKAIKFVTNREGLGIVELMDPMSAQQVIDFLNNVDMLGGTIRITLSDQDKIKENTQDLRLKDGTSAMKHYDQLRLNRFMTPSQAAKNKPKRDISGLVLYFWGCPDHSDEETVLNVLRDNGVDFPCKVNLQNQNGTSGWVTFDNPNDATDAICLANHSIITGDIKIKFSYAVADGNGGRKN